MAWLLAEYSFYNQCQLTLSFSIYYSAAAYY